MALLPNMKAAGTWERRSKSAGAKALANLAIYPTGSCDHKEIADQLETSLRHRDVLAIRFNPETKRRSLAVLRFPYWAKDSFRPDLVFAWVILLLIHHNKHVFDNKY